MRCLSLLILLVTVDPVAAAEWLNPYGIKGQLFIAGGGQLPDEVFMEFIKLAGDKEAKLVVVPTASLKADDPKQHAGMLEPAKRLGVENVTLLHTRDRQEADSEEFLKPLREATAVWFSGGSQSRIAEAYLGTAFETELQKLLERDGVIGGTSAGAAIQSRVMIASGNPDPVVKQGFDLLPGAIIDQHFLKRNRKPRLIKALSDRPGLFGIGIDEGTAVVVQGRLMRVLGSSSATFILSAGAGRPVREVEVTAGRPADLTALRRAARDRTMPPFPEARPHDPHVAGGTLMIVGGGGMPGSLVKRFIAAAGGPEALIVVLPVSSPTPRSGEGFKRYLERFGAKNVKVLPQRRREDVESDEVLSALKQAGGIWFGGGRQWRFMDAYEGTKAEPLIHEVLNRGGIIAGSSAGASIQAEYMVRGNPLGNTDMMAAGYERGLGFLPGVAIDQHFTQRNRLADLESVIKRFPQLMGIGIDETTAIIVKGHTAEIAGRHTVSFYYPEQESEISKTTLQRDVLFPGAIYDLIQKRTLKPAAPPLPDRKPRRRTRPRPRTQPRQTAQSVTP